MALTKYCGVTTLILTYYTNWFPQSLSYLSFALTIAKFNDGTLVVACTYKILRCHNPDFDILGI